MLWAAFDALNMRNHCREIEAERPSTCKGKTSDRCLYGWLAGTDR